MNFRMLVKMSYIYLICVVERPQKNTILHAMLYKWSSRSISRSRLFSYDPLKNQMHEPNPILFYHRDVLFNASRISVPSIAIRADS